MLLQVKVGEWVEFTGFDGFILKNGDKYQVVKVEEFHMWFRDDDSGPWYRETDSFQVVTV